MTRLNPLKCGKETIYHQGMCRRNVNSRDLSKIKKIRDNMNQINKLMFSQRKIQKDPELFEAVVLRSKLHHFNFLTGRTRVLAVGDWKDTNGKKYDEEKNVIVQVQFRDTKDEKVGKEITQRFKKLNMDLIGERLLYTRTIPIEETSL